MLITGSEKKWEYNVNNNMSHRKDSEVGQDCITMKLLFEGLKELWGN